MTRRLAADVAADYRKLADALDALPADIELPTHCSVFDYDYGSDAPNIDMQWLLFGENEPSQAERAAAIVRLLGGKWGKIPNDLFSFKSSRDGIAYSVTVKREAVCTRVVTGTEEVVRLVPAADAPMVEITETVETVEWRCEPLLAERAS